MRFAKPLDEALLHKIFKKHNRIITVEDGTIKGGFGSAILEFMAEHDYHSKVKLLGMPDKVVEHGTQDQLYTECNYDADSIEIAARKLLEMAPQAL